MEASLLTAGKDSYKYRKGESWNESWCYNWRHLCELQLSIDRKMCTHTHAHARVRTHTHTSSGHGTGLGAAIPQ